MTKDLYMVGVCKENDVTVYISRHDYSLYDRRRRPTLWWKTVSGRNIELTKNEVLLYKHMETGDDLIEKFNIVI